ncbi:uncharacterized protein LOC143276879 [Babylonia areolata]|uniref:uncharacterized protein LOC143276879 n=1 Tax=Babylonia areolata TaxID=304850 RepID=UPI003FD3F8BE
MEDWQYALLRCLDDQSICLIACIAPCYQYSLNAEAMDHNCVACCIIYAAALTCCLHGCMGAYMRTLIRDQKDIDGTPIWDCVLHCVVPCMALVQEGKEMEVVRLPEEVTQQDIARQ